MRLPTILHKVTACCLLLTLSAASRLCATEEDSTLELLDPKTFDYNAAAHLLSRAGFGGTPEEIQDLEKIGLNAAVSKLLSGTPDDDPVGDFRVETTDKPMGRREFRRLPQERKKRLRQQFRRSDTQQCQKLRAWWIRRMVLTPRPLEEKMLLFWHGHFTSAQREVKNSHFLYLQNQTLRKNALGNFRNLVHTITRDPAMLKYLNNNQNNRRKPNENFARELMELFTLGVGNYSERDVKEAARAFTGWKFHEGGEFFIQWRQHDSGVKSFMGREGHLNGNDIIDTIFGQPAAARFLAGKIFRFFAHEEAPGPVLEALAKTLREHDFELRPFLSQLFRCKEFYSERARGSRIKSPVELVVGSLRLLGMDPGESVTPALLAAQLGQNLFQPPNVKGWDGGRDWISTSTIVERYRLPKVLLSKNGMGMGMMRRSRDTNMVTRLPHWDPTVDGKRLLGDRSSSEEKVTHLLKHFLVVPLSDTARQELIRILEENEDGRGLQKALEHIMSSPSYQLG